MTFSCKESVKECKIRFILMLVISIIGLFLGVFLAIRVNNAGQLENIGDYGFAGFSLLKISSFSSFFTRILSLGVIVGFLALFSLSPLLYILAGVVLAYRSYLVGLNITIIIITNGLAGIFTTIFIILPCQLLLLVLLGMFFAVFSKKTCECKKVGSGGRWKSFAIIGGLLLIAALVESLLLLVFSSNVILVV